MNLLFSTKYPFERWSHFNAIGDRYVETKRLVSQMRAPLVACREPAGKLWQLCKVLYVFEHKAQYLLIHAPITRIVVFDTLVTYPQWVKFVVILPRFVFQQYSWNIAIQPAMGCYNSWANLRCSSCSPLGEKSLWNGTNEGGVYVITSSDGSLN